MTVFEAPTRGRIAWLLDQLGRRWTAGNAESLVHHLAEALGSPVAFEDRDEGNAIRFRLDLSRVYLGGLGDRVGAVLAGGDGPEVDASLRAFNREIGGGGLGFPLAFCVTEGAYRAARQILPPRFSLVIGPAALAGILADERPIRALTRHASDQISRLALSVYSVLRPAEIAFFGREREQKLLFEDLRSSYAIAGPGRVGKSSLLKRHARNLRRRGDPRSTRLYEFDFMHMKESRDDEVARYIATQIRAGRRSDRTTAAGLARFLHDCRSESDGPLELLLDETDLVCDGEAFRQLGHAAKEGFVRLVLCGRKGLFDFASRDGSPLGQRLVLMRLPPLSEPEARDLVRLPLEALGLSLSPEADVLRLVLDRTGRLPHLIQYYAKHLVELSNEHGCDRITAEFVAELEAREDFSEAFLAPLEDLSGRPIYDLACALLGDGRDRFETADAWNILTALGRPGLDLPAVRRACDELVISNILSWDRGGYRIASPLTREMARRAGLL